MYLGSVKKQSISHIYLDDIGVCDAWACFRNGRRLELDGWRIDAHSAVLLCMGARPASASSLAHRHGGRRAGMWANQRWRRRSENRSHQHQLAWRNFPPPHGIRRRDVASAASGWPWASTCSAQKMDIR